MSVRETPAVARRVLAAPGYRALFAVGLVGYLVTYLVAIGDLAYHAGRTGVSLFVIDAPLANLFRTTGPFQWEPIALLEAGLFAFEIAPPTVALGLVLSTLVALNLTFAAVSLRQERACRRRGAYGVFAAVPGLLSGSACCGPVVLLVVGVQASGALVALFGLLVPIALVLLTGSLLWMGRDLAATWTAR